MGKRDIEFLYEIGTLRNIERTWKQVLGPGVATVLEHTVRVVFLALLLARMEGEKDEERVIKMALVHDLPESRTGDANYVHAVYTKRDDRKAAKDLFGGTSLLDFETDILRDYEGRKSRISRIVKDADNLDVEMELMELKARGSDTARHMTKNRRAVLLKKLYTPSAKKLWREGQTVNPASWFLASTKWAKEKKAGK